MNKEDKLNRAKTIYHLAKSELNRISRADYNNESSMININDAYIDMLDYVVEQAFKDILELSNLNKQNFIKKGK